eukprot:CAMPEP_0202462074 /NCGR_PEP_ID=MMETSP1360-20130828/52368_1 /ASSEMBLY_ACC=CAM_ASM_000848 /TAXON_ID=515479 /ORGANISM="Licmophora paradoxa, Strain CCMP2313" /LENGTH=98 /DNA_ID=CAMNT_0049084387 /DNA_START=353 /DNA_END=649 /DNA_ORIENTATION=+
MPSGRGRDDGVGEGVLEAFLDFRHVVGVLIEVGFGGAYEGKEEGVGALCCVGGRLEIHLTEPELASGGASAGIFFKNPVRFAYNIECDPVWEFVSDEL